MKILILSDDFPPQSFGGAGRIAFQLAKEFRNNGHELFVISTTEDKKKEGESKFENLYIYKIYSSYHHRWRAYLSLYNPQAIRMVKKQIKRFKPDIVHVHTLHYHLSYHSLKVAKKSGAKVFLTAHDTLLFHYGKLVEFVDPNNLSTNQKKDYKINSWQQVKAYKKRYNPLRNAIIRYYLRYVDKIFPVSNALQNALNQNKIKNTKVIHNGIAIKDWAVKDKIVNNFEDKYKLHNKKVVLFGGRLSGLKGAEASIKVMNRVAQKIPESLLLVIGKKDDNAQKMFELAQEKKVKIIFTGWIAGEELKAAYYISDLVITPSIYLDPFPTINLEAMACSKPVIGTCFGGTPEVVQNGVTGYIVNPLNIIGMAEKIIGLLRNSQKARQFGEAGNKVVRENFNLETQARKYLESFDI